MITKYRTSLTSAADLKAGDYLLIDGHPKKIARIDSKYFRHWDWYTIVFEDGAQLGPCI